MIDDCLFNRQLSIVVRQFDKHVVAFDVDDERRVLDVLVQAVSAGGDIELPSVPRAGHDVAVESSLTEGSACVRADSVERVKSALDVVQGDDSPGDGQLLRGARRDVADGGNAKGLRHGTIEFGVRSSEFGVGYFTP